MEEVWKDINLASLHDHPSADQHISVAPTLHNPHHDPNLILQDFFAKPFTKDPPKRIPSAHSQGDPPLYASPPTVLSLNSGSAFDFLHNSGPLPLTSHLPTHPVSNVSSLITPFEALDSSSGLPSLGKKRVQESDNSSCDRRHKRMIKNRESAARSRARKQAYTSELEHEIEHLMEENAKLKRQQEELLLAASTQHPKKHSLHRTSTAPF